MSEQASFPGWTGALDTHYLGVKGARGRMVYQDKHGTIVLSGVTSRRLPNEWLELSRWCIVDGGRGSQQWKDCLEWLRGRTQATTIVSYSDPSVGHTGALYRACNWIWAPVWHVLREPPTGMGVRSGKAHRAKHRWVYLLARDDGREEVLRLKDEALERRYPWASYREPKWKRGHPILSGLMGRYRTWTEASQHDRL